jgi:FkbM family methyltransferase
VQPRCACASARSRDGGLIIANLIAKGRKLACVLISSTWRRALLSYRVAAGVEHLVLLRHLGEVRTVVDIGANRGQFALTARHCYPAARIVSFEPLSGPAAVYRSVFANDSHATLHQVAIAPRAGKTTIHVSHRDDSSSLLPIAAAQSALFPGTAEAGTALSSVRTSPCTPLTSRSTRRAAPLTALPAPRSNGCKPKYPNRTFGDLPGKHPRN